MWTLKEMYARWEARREEQRRLGGCVDGVRVCDEILADLEACEKASGETLLKVAQAAEISGRSVDHIQHLIRKGKIPNSGCKGAPRVRYADLMAWMSPHVAPKKKRGYDSAADARALRAVR